MKRVMDKRQRACQIWGSSREEEVDSEGRPSLGEGRAGVDLDPTVVVAEAGAVGMEGERESVGLWAAV